MKLLLVSEDADFRQVLSYALRQQGHSVQAARLGYEAVSLGYAQVPNVVLVDVNPPVFLDLREFAQRVPIIVSTASNDAQHLLEYRHLGAAAVLVKPYRIQELVGVLKRFESVYSGDQPFPGRAGEVA